MHGVHRYMYRAQHVPNNYTTWLFLNDVIYKSSVWFLTIVNFKSGEVEISVPECNTVKEFSNQVSAFLQLSNNRIEWGFFYHNAEVLTSMCRRTCWERRKRRDLASPSPISQATNSSSASDTNEKMVSIKGHGHRTRLKVGGREGDRG